MMTKMTGTLVRVLDDEVRVAVGPFEYAVMVSEAVRRQLQLKAGQEVTLHLTEYFEGNQSGSRMVPRKIGFNTEVELEFFELFCTVEKIGVKKALKAMSRGVKEIADAISRQDAKWLTTLPGIGATTAEQIITTLKRKVAPFALSPGAVIEAEAVNPDRKGAKKPTPANPDRKGGGVPSPEPDGLPSGQLIEDVYQAMMSVGHSPIEAREKLDRLLQSGQRFETIEDALTLIYGRG
jgi:holliday junction DNA helicase RuvA